jgi:hypothetical protein
MSSTLDLGVEWRRSKQGGIIKAWWTEVVMQCTRSGGDGNHWGVTRWGERRPWCAPCASLSGAKEKGGDGVRLTRRRASNGAPKEKKEGRSGTGTRARIESRHGCQGQRGVLCDMTSRVRHNAVATRVPPQTASAGHAVTATRHAHSVKPITGTTSSQTLQLLRHTCG